MDRTSRYTSRAHAGARFVAQRCLLKPLVWSLTSVTVFGRERLASLAAPFVVISNHTSHLDAPLILGALPRRLARYVSTGVAADYFFDVWWRKAPTSLFFNAFPIERSGSQGRRRGLASKLIDDGVPLLLFPEATRSRTGEMGRFTPGPAALCISRKVPCLPVAIVGAHLAMPAEGFVKPGRPPVSVCFGDPMRADPGESAQEFSDRIAKEVVGLYDYAASYQADRKEESR